MRGRSPFAAQKFPSGRFEIIVSNVRQGSANVLKVLMRELYCGRDVTVMLEYPGWGESFCARNINKIFLNSSLFPSYEVFTAVLLLLL
jgi:hypothetical protein